jgi:hypothetical protein
LILDSLLEYILNLFRAESIFLFGAAWQMKRLRNTGACAMFLAQFVLAEFKNFARYENTNWAHCLWIVSFIVPNGQLKIQLSISPGYIPYNEENAFH